MALTWWSRTTRTGYDAAACGKENIGTSGCGVARASPHAEPDAYWARRFRLQWRESAAAMLSPTSTGQSTSGSGFARELPQIGPDAYWVRHIRPRRCESVLALPAPSGIVSYNWKLTPLTKHHSSPLRNLTSYLCGWKHPRASRMALLFGDERATKAVLSFLRKTKVGQMVTIPPRDGGERWRGGGGSWLRGGEG